jgi:hypothetical protein
MTRIKSVTMVVLVLAFAAWCENEGTHATAQTQEADKVLEIERYPDEPLQLVNLRIGTQSVSDHIKLKFKDPKSKWGIDSVKFSEKDDWYKRVSITLRNASNKPVYGVQGFLYFKPVGLPTIFSLQLKNSKELWREPLEPGAEIELSVNQEKLDQTLVNLKDHGTDASVAVVSLSVDSVRFSKELQWYRGKLLRPDPTIPHKWVPIDKP